MRLLHMLSRALLPLLLASLLVPAAASARVPSGWLGVNVEPAPLVKRGTLDDELRRIHSAGGQTVRFAVFWSAVQPYANAHRVPARKRRFFHDVGGVPTDFRGVDKIVAAAAHRRVALIPVLLNAPRWAAADAPAPVARPRDPAEFARFAAALVNRYGAHGSYWAAHRRVRRAPVRTWQIWNEVSNAFYWGPTWETEYPRLLRTAYDAIKGADRSATVMMSGLNTGGGGGKHPQTSWSVMDRLYGQFDAQGLGRPFDVAAVHIYTSRVGDALRVITETRKVMASHGDGTRPLRVTELAWPAAQGHTRKKFFAATTDRGMAQRLRSGISLLASHRRADHIAGVDWFQWTSSYHGRSDPFTYSGLRMLRRGGASDRPALGAFRKLARKLRRP